MSTIQETTFTPDDLLTMPEGEHFELIDGQLREKEIGAESDLISNDLRTLLSNFVKQRQLGYVFGSGTGYQCFPDDQNLVRKPDGSFIAKGRLPGGRIPKGHITIVPDLAIEVISPNDLYYDVEAKVSLYQRAGFRLIWVVNPDQRTVKVYSVHRDYPIELTEGDELDGGEVLPGFRCRVSDIFPDSESEQ